MPDAIDTAYVEVKPDLDGFVAELRTKLEAAFKTVAAGLHDQIKVPPVDVPLHPDDAPLRKKPPATPPADVPLDPLFDRFRADMKARTAALAKEIEAKIPARADTEQLRTDLAEQVALLQRHLSVKVPAEPADRRRFELEMRALAEEVEHQVKVHLPVDVDRPALARARETVEKEVEKGAERAGTGFAARFTASVGRVLVGGLTAALATAAVSAAATSAVQLTAALVPAVGVVGLLPAAGVAAGVAIGTLAVALHGVGDALKAGLTGNTTALAKAMEQLGPAAQDAVKAILSLKPALTDIRNTVQERFFAGFGEDVGRLAGAYLPALKTTLADVAGGFNQVAHQVVALGTTPAAVAATTAAFHEVAVAVTNAAQVLPGLIAGLATIGHVGASLLPGLTAGFGQLGDKFAAFIDRIAASGQLQQFMQAGIDTATQLGHVLFDLGAVVTDLLKAGSATGGGLLNNLDQILGAVHEFLSSVQGQNVLQAFFTGAGQALSALLPIVTGLAAALGPAIGPLLADLTAAFQALAPAAAPVGQAISAVVTALSPLLPLIGAQLANVLTVAATALQSLALVLGPIIGLLGDSLTAAAQAVLPVLTQLAAQVLPVIATAAAQVAQAFAPLVPVIAQVAATLAGQLAAALPGLVASFVQLVPHIVTFAEQAGGVLLTALQTLAPFLPQLADAGIQLADALIKMFAAVDGAVLDALTQGLVGLAPHLPDLVTSFAELAVVLAQAAAAAAPIITWLAELAGPLLTATAGFGLFIDVLGLVVDAVAGVVGFVAGLPEQIGTLATAIGDGLSSAFTTVTDTVGTAITTVVDFVTALPGQIGAALAALPGVLMSLATAAFNQFTYAVGFAIGSVIRYFLDLPGNIAAAFSAITAAVSAGANAVVTWIGQMQARAVAIVQSLWNSAVSITASGISSVISFVSNLPGTISSLAQSAWNAAVSAFNSGVATVTSIASSLPGRIGSALSGAASWLVGVGRDIIMGLVNGIESAAGAAASAARRAVSNALQGAKDALGISSPSKVFADQVGRWIPEGIAVGIDRNIEVTQRAVADALSPAAAVEGTAVPAAPATAPGAGAPLVQVFLGDREITDILRVLVDGVLVDQARTVAAGPRTF